VTYTIESLHPKGDGGYPVPLSRLPEELRKGAHGKSKYVPYKMSDLTIGSWMRLGRALGEPKGEKLRVKFGEYMFMGS
jgi:endopolyphosphatase